MMSDAVSTERGKHLAFALGSGNFAIDVARVEVVLEMQPITRVPRSKSFLRGVTNHRGSVIPIVDLKMRFGMGASEISPATSIIVLQLGYGGEMFTVGLLADGVREVVDLSDAGIEKAPSIGGRIDESVIEGIAKDDSGGFVIIIDIDEAFKDAGIHGSGTVPGVMAG
ncbi:MAG: chemotaxis protein CheW [Spirochaetes bacterium]|nr:chemotaxis protein CheW [Spirochaetota bacterium]